MNKYRGRGKKGRGIRTTALLPPPDRPTLWGTLPTCPHKSSGGNVMTRHLALDALQQPGQHPAGTDLVETVEAGRQQVAHGLFPKDWLHHLLHQPLADFLRPGM